MIPLVCCNKRDWHKRQPRVALTRLQELPHTAKGDKKFLALVEQESTLLDAYVLLIERELPRRPYVYEELIRLVRRHRPAFNN